MLICGQDDPSHEPSPAQIDQTMGQIRAWYEKWMAAGKISDGGAELRPAVTAKTVRPDADGRPLVTDGPYAELKEVVGGVVFLECADLDEAVAIAAEWPDVRPDSWMTAIEVRPTIQG